LGELEQHFGAPGFFLITLPPIWIFAVHGRDLIGFCVPGLFGPQLPRPFVGLSSRDRIRPLQYGFVNPPLFSACDRRMVLFSSSPHSYATNIGVFYVPPRRARDRTALLIFFAL